MLLQKKKGKLAKFHTNKIWINIHLHHWVHVPKGLGMFYSMHMTFHCEEGPKLAINKENLKLLLKVNYTMPSICNKLGLKVPLCFYSFPINISSPNKVVIPLNWSFIVGYGFQQALNYRIEARSTWLKTLPTNERLLLPHIISWALRKTIMLVEIGYKQEMNTY